MIESRALTSQEMLLLYLRYGRDDGVAPQPEVAKALGLSLGAVRRMEQEALRQLRLGSCNPLAKGWNGWDEV